MMLFHPFAQSAQLFLTCSVYIDRIERENSTCMGEEGLTRMMTDSQMIQEIKQGNVEVYSELMRRHQRKILAFVYHMLKSSNLEMIAEDLCSETFYKAYRSLHSFAR